MAPSGRAWSWGGVPMVGLEGRGGPEGLGGTLMRPRLHPLPSSLAQSLQCHRCEARNLGFHSHARHPSPPSGIPCQAPIHSVSHLRISWLSSRRSVPRKHKEGSPLTSTSLLWE